MAGTAPDRHFDADALRSRLAAIVDSSDDAILSKALDGTILSWNKGAERLYGYSAEEAVGQNITMLVPPDRPEEVPDILVRIRRGEAVDHFDTVRIDREGRHIPVSLTISPVRNADGAIIGASTIARDVTERRRMAAALAEARDAALEASRLKSEFLATMSHEIRTPMNGVIGMTGLLLDTELDPEQREYAETVRSSAEALLAVINDILDFSKIEADKLELEIIDFDPGTVVEEVADLLAETAHAKGLELAVSIESDVPELVRGDPGRVRQVLNNLVANAVKFTERGEVVVRVEVVEQTAGEIVVCFEVADTGIGVAPDKQAELFEAFSQADASTTRTHGGTGLGLAISKRLVERMGGQIGVESEPGAGSRFWFTTRLAKQTDAAAAVPARRDDLRGLRVLVVDDNETNRKILEHQVRSWEMHPVTAEGGERALELLRAAATQGEHYDVALLDMEMPGMDGLELSRAMAADGSLAQTPRLLLSSSGLRGTRDQARAAGISAYLTKPVRQSNLYDALAMVMGGGAADVPLLTHQAVAHARAEHRPRLLVAEDNPVNQKVAVATLEKLGYRADVVANGAEAVEALSRVPYGAVLMDCQMPEMDGYEASAEIRRREDRTPIIAMTASAMAEDRDRCLVAGMDDYLSKPVDAGELAEVLKRWVNSEDAGGAGAGPASGAHVPDDAASIDRERLSMLRGLQPDDPSCFRELVESFLEDAASQLAALQAATTSGDAHTVQEGAHSLTGSCLNFGASGMGDIGAQLEAVGRSGDLSTASQLISRLEGEFARVRGALRSEVAQASQEPRLPSLGPEPG
jgi:PAS domain S-box-containing protein